MGQHPYPHQPYPQAAQYTYSKRRQSIKVHLILLVTTGGLGNLLYWGWARSKTAARYEW